MKKLLLAILIFGSSIGAMAQTSNDCGFIIPPSSIRSNFASTYEARSYIDQMLNQIDWQQNFQVREQNGINNAYATIIRNQRYIVYDNRFLEKLDSYAGTKWASISVLAHEVGHHYYNHVLGGSGSSISKELEADYFSGYVMAKMGASLEAAKAAMTKIASTEASHSHPAKSNRLDAITNGWNKAKGTTAQPAPQNPGSQQNNQVDENDASWIQLSTYGNSDMNVFLSDDGNKFQSVQVKTSQPFVFKFDVYDYGWLRLGNNRNSKTYKLYHGRDYAILWNRRANNYTVVEVQ